MAQKKEQGEVVGANKSCLSAVFNGLEACKKKSLSGSQVVQQSVPLRVFKPLRANYRGYFLTTSSYTRFYRFGYLDTAVMVH